MPVVINEVIIRAVVDSRPDKEEKEGDQPPPSGTTGQEVDIAEKIFDIIRQKLER
jgi:hypothetical protein